MFEKVNMYHPDKLADRIAGALVDLAYGEDEAPKIAVEVLLGHGRATVIAETSVTLADEAVAAAVQRIAGDVELHFTQVSQDTHLSRNQRDGVRCGDNGVFAAKWNPDYARATELAKRFGTRFPYDGKYLFDFQDETATICQSNAPIEEIEAFPGLVGFKRYTINPIGDWTGGPDTDTGCTNRKLGSDQPFCNPNGLHGKDLSKADVSMSIYLNALSRKNGGAFVTAYCSIGDSAVNILVDGNPIPPVPFDSIVEYARDYIRDLGGFEKFAEYGMV